MVSTKSTVLRSKILGGVGGIAVTAEEVKAWTRDAGREAIKDKSVIYIYHNMVDARGDSSSTESETFEYQQHTSATGQCFEKDALDLIYDNTLGQPWLVNALGRELCFGKHAPPREHTITVNDVRNAVEILIKRRDVHLDQLIDKINEPRVQRVIQPILLGEAIESSATAVEDQQYLIDLGLIRVGKVGLEIANPMYKEVIPRELTVVEEQN